MKHEILCSSLPLLLYCMTVVAEDKFVEYQVMILTPHNLPLNILLPSSFRTWVDVIIFLNKKEILASRCSSDGIITSKVWILIFTCGYSWSTGFFNLTLQRWFFSVFFMFFVSFLFLFSAFFSFPLFFYCGKLKLQKNNVNSKKSD